MSESKKDEITEEQLNEVAGGKQVRRATGDAQAKTRHESGTPVKFRRAPNTEN